MRWLICAVALAACGPSPDAVSTGQPGGTLVIVIRQGPERVPFYPKIDRIRRANEQLAAILGHSIQIELDGSLLPQDHDGAQDVIARLVETVARDIDALKKEEPKAAPFAAANFERLVVRYSPTENAKRTSDYWHRHDYTKLEDKTIDVTLKEASWVALERGDIASPLLRAYESQQDSRFLTVLPDGLSARDQQGWLDYHLHWHKGGAPKEQLLGSVDSIEVRGMVHLARAGNAEARKYLIEHVVDSFSGVYHHQQAEVEAAQPGSPFKLAEADFVPWLQSEAAKMTPEERTHLARYVWVYDFRKNQTGERDKYASYSFPGFDLMAFGFQQVDGWIAAKHPVRSVDVYDRVVDPVERISEHGEIRFQPRGDLDTPFYRWALATSQREDTFMTLLLQRNDPAWAMTAFWNMHYASKDEADYLRLLRRVERSPVHWQAGSELLAAITYRPSEQLLEECRRQWREVPSARGYDLMYFARTVEVSYHPDADFRDLLQDEKPDDAVLRASLDLGWMSFRLLPVYWHQVQPSNTRLGIVENAARAMWAADARAQPGEPDVAGILAKIGRVDCEDGNMAEVAELRRWAEAELPKNPGRGLSHVLEATDAKECKPKRRPSPPPAKHSPPSRPPPQKIPLKQGDF